MRLTLLVQHRMVYGKPLIYPGNELARTACSLLGKKTLSDADLKTLETMGFSVEWFPQDETLPESEPSPEGTKAREHSEAEALAESRGETASPVKQAFDEIFGESLEQLRELGIEVEEK